MKTNKNTVIFIIGIIILIILKQLLVCDLPIYANVALGADDGLMMKEATSIIAGEWLGEYKETTFMKGEVFPIFLSLIYFLHIDYISAITILYTISCLVMLAVISKLIKNKKILFLIYAILLFNPIMLTNSIIFRVYRNSLIPAFTLFIVAGYINLFLERNNDNKKGKILTLIGINIILSIFWFTREDSVWILPYVIFMSGAILVSIIYKNKKVNKEFWKNLVILCTPALSIILIANIISVVNYSKYGVYTVRNNYYYNKAVNAINNVKANVSVERVTNTREKMNRIAEVTVLGTIMPEYDILADGYSKIDGNQQDDEVENGWFRFAFTTAAKEAGYYKNVQDTNNFYNTLAIQINDAIDKGLLEKEDRKKDYFEFLGDIIISIKDCVIYIFNFDGIELDVMKTPRKYTAKYEEAFKNYSRITRNKLIFSEDSDKLNDKDIVNFEQQDKYLNSISYKNNIVKNITVFYKILNIIFFGISAIYYIYCTIGIIRNKKNLLQNWVILSGFLGAIFTVIVGISYTNVKYFSAITSLYLVGTYPLMIAFDLIGTYNCFAEICNRKK